jgi:hypothetical protein
MTGCKVASATPNGNMPQRLYHAYLSVQEKLFFLAEV